MERTSECYTCRHFYEEYGFDLCKKQDFMPEDSNEKCPCYEKDPDFEYDVSISLNEEPKHIAILDNADIEKINKGEEVQSRRAKNENAFI